MKQEVFWTHEREMTCVKLARSGMSPEGVGKQMGKSEAWIISKLATLMRSDEHQAYLLKWGLRKEKFDWTVDRIQRLWKMTDDGHDVAAMCAEFSVTSYVILKQLKQGRPVVQNPKPVLRAVPTRGYRHWAPEEDEILREGAKNRNSLKVIAEAVGRTEKNVRNRIQRSLSFDEYTSYMKHLGLKYHQKWSPEDLAKLLMWAGEFIAPEEIARRLKRANGVSSVLAMLSRTLGPAKYHIYVTRTGTTKSKAS